MRCAQCDEHGCLVEGVENCPLKDDGSLPLARNANADRLADKFKKFATVLREGAHMQLTPTQLRELLNEAWDAGNCTGLDGWVGPGRGGDVDDQALYNRERDIDLVMQHHLT